MFRNLRTRKAPPIPVAKPSTPNSDTTLGTHATLEGTLTSEGNVRIQGTFDGDITTKGNVHIGEAGKVEGHIKGQAVAVGGMVRGDIEAKRIAVLRTGRVWGDLTTGSLTTEEGGFIQGVITMKSEEVQETDVDELLSDLEAQMADAVKAAEKKSKE